MNGVWKTTLEKNFLKSLDYRSYDFRQVDKKQFTARYMYQELKERRQNVETMRLREQERRKGAVAMQEEQESKEEKEQRGANGVEGGNKPGRKRNRFKQKWETDEEVVDSTKPIATGIMAPSLEAHMAFQFRDLAIFKDVVKVLWYALEQGSVSSAAADRAPSFSLWKDFLRLFFSIHVHALFSMQPLLPPGLVAKEVTGQEAWEPGTVVLTMMGRARVVAFREADSTYTLDLLSASASGMQEEEDDSEEDGSSSSTWATAYVRPTAIIGVEELSEPTLEAIGLVKKGDVWEEPWEGEAGGKGPEEAAPKAYSAESWTELDTDPSEDYFVGTSTMYLVVRLLCMMAERLKLAREVAEPGQFKAFQAHLLAVLDGQTDSAKFEENVRELFGNKAFMLFDLDRVVAQTVKQIHIAGNDPTLLKLVAVYHYHRLRQRRPHDQPQQEGVTLEQKRAYLRHVIHIFEQEQLEDEVYIFSRKSLTSAVKYSFPRAFRFGEKLYGMSSSAFIYPPAEDGEEEDDYDEARSSSSSEEEPDHHVGVLINMEVKPSLNS
jgi:hypothetical protein